MLKIRKSEDRGKANHGWLTSRHTFSFADYSDSEHMGFGALRVINEDLVAPGKGFPTHAHNNMEIFSYLISGELAHKDSMGNGRTIHTGELQAISAGTGITHSEFNPSSEKDAHFLQIWIVPNEKNLAPSYSEWKPDKSTEKLLTLLASPDARDGSMKVNQDVFLYLANFKSNQSIEHKTSTDRRMWLQLIEGAIIVNEKQISSGDGVAITEEESLEILSISEGRYLLFDLA